MNTPNLPLVAAGRCRMLDVIQVIHVLTRWFRAGHMCQKLCSDSQESSSAVDQWGLIEPQNSINHSDLIELLLVLTTTTSL